MPVAAALPTMAGMTYTPPATTDPRPWLRRYPEGVPPELDLSAAPRTLLELVDDSLQRHATRTAYRFLGHDTRFADTDRDARALAAYFQSLGLKKGDRVALMMPNVPQYPAAVIAALRAGLVVVNVNPLYTPRELEHQLRDSGATAIVIVENFAATLQACIARTAVRHVVLTCLGDTLGWLKGALVNFVVRRVKKLVPAYHLQGAVRWREALAQGRQAPFAAPVIGPDDLALLQYTGGTTGVSKGAMLLHRNLVANVMQAAAWYQPVLRALPAGEVPCTVCALPLYHIFAFTVNMMLSLRTGGMTLLIVNPRDVAGTLKTLSRQRFHILPAVNTLFNVLARHPLADRVDWSGLRLSIGGGMAVQSAVARLWLEKTGCPICEGYGLSETAPIVSCNPVDVREWNGSIGLPVPGTEVALLDDAGQALPIGQSGEIAVRGPQLMAGYWQRPDETAKAMTADGWFRTGDIGVMDEGGFIRIVDRKKDMILVSGFNVYPNEVEDVCSAMPGVLECAAVGVPSEQSGETVKLVIVRRDPALTEADVRAWCKARLTGYKRPQHIEFRDELPKSAVGKVLRRALRDAVPVTT